MDRRSMLALLVAGGGALQPSDRTAFRAWFCWLAESMYFIPEGRRPAEVKDCSGLLRFAYREALRRHTAEWARGLGYEWMPPLPELQLSVSPLFRTAESDARHFADVENLMRHNAFQVSREIESAQPGDLLFYRQQEGYHSMAYLGRSTAERSPERYVVYHTGEVPGEVRRPTLAELRNFPEPRWRPLPANSNYLGVYRWNILRDAW